MKNLLFLITCLLVFSVSQATGPPAVYDSGGDLPGVEVHQDIAPDCSTTYEMTAAAVVIVSACANSAAVHTSTQVVGVLTSVIEKGGDGISPHGKPWPVTDLNKINDYNSISINAGSHSNHGGKLTPIGENSRRARDGLTASPLT